MRYRKSWSYFVVYFLAAAVFPGIAQTRITVDPSVTYQEFEGWGTSICWWGNLEGSGSVAYRSRIADLLIDPDSGLGFTHFRYNIGGGDQPGHNHMRSGGAIPGYKPTESGPYDWTADQNQRNIVAALAERAAAKKIDLVWEAFSNSPPWWMTISGCAAGNVNGADNLKPDYFDDFADYLTEVVKHFRDFWGITFRTVAPFNEPSAGWWTEGNNQEGCGFKANQARMVKLLGKSLVAKGLFPATTVSAADENAVNEAVSGLASYDDSAFSFMSQINTHTYYGRTATNFTNLYTLATRRQKLLWQSETGPLAGKGTQDIALFMAQYIIQDLRMLKPNAWLDWQTVGTGDWGTFTVNRTTLALVPTRRYYMQAAFSRFIRPGARFIHSSDSNSLAALVPSTGNLVLVIRNGGTADITYVWDLTKCSSLGTAVRVYQYRVSNYQALSRLADIAITNKQFSLISPAQSVTTCVIPGSVATARTTACDRLLPRVSALRCDGRTLHLRLPDSGPFLLTLVAADGRIVRSMASGSCGGGATTIALGPQRLPPGIYGVHLRQGGVSGSGMVHVMR